MEKFTVLEAIAAPLMRINIDTDVIIPSREMKRVSKEGLSDGMFANWRYKEPGGREENPEFVLNQEPYRRAQILLSGDNFGCGSSREHAPQALMRFGFNAFVAGSFAEIFAGNCTALGLVCVSLGTDDLARLMDSVELDPQQEIEIDVAAQTVKHRGGVLQGTISSGTRTQLTQGTWDATSVLLDAGDAIEETAAKLPYVAGY